MQIVTYTDARNNLKEVLDEACNNDAVISITRKAGEHCVVMSLDHYNNLMDALDKENIVDLVQGMKELLEEIRNEV